MASYVKVKNMFHYIIESVTFDRLKMESYDVAQGLRGTTLLEIALVRKVFISDLFSQT